MSLVLFVGSLESLDDEAVRENNMKTRSLTTNTQTLHGTAIYAYIDPSNHPNVGKYYIYMECLGYNIWCPPSTYSQKDLTRTVPSSAVLPVVLPQKDWTILAPTPVPPSQKLRLEPWGCSVFSLNWFAPADTHRRAVWPALAGGEPLA